jgi:hypothetical protein
MTEALRDEIARTLCCPHSCRNNESLYRVCQAQTFHVSAIAILPIIARVRAEALEEYAWSRDLNAAPAACCVLAARFDDEAAEWFVCVEPTPIYPPWTHWRMLDTPDTLALKDKPDVG